MGVCVCVCESVSVCVHALKPCSVSLSETPWPVTCQAPLSMGFSRQAYWNRLAFPPPRDLPDPGMEPEALCLLHWQANSLSLVPP